MNRMDTKRYVFIGNRAYVLKEMIKLQLNIQSVFVMENSFLHKTLQNDKFIDYVVITSKRKLLDYLAETSYDILISNGCKYILPVKNMREALYVNIHPSYLPDLKGMDPINAACLFNRDCGATCHLMDEGIDTGRIISREKIVITNDIEAALLYQLCFKAEVLAFRAGYVKCFEPLSVQPTIRDAIYFTQRKDDYIVKFENGFDYILRQSKAFGYKSKGLYFKCNGILYRFFRASEVINPFVIDNYFDMSDLQVVFAFENSVVFKLNDRFMRFDQILNMDGQITEGDYICSCTIEEIS